MLATGGACSLERELYSKASTWGSVVRYFSELGLSLAKMRVP